MCCITSDEPGVVVMGSEPILDQETAIGYVTSADYGYSVGKGIAYGYLPVSYSEIGTGLEIEYLGRRYPATVASEPLYDPDNLKMRV